MGRMGTLKLIGLAMTTAAIVGFGDAASAVPQWCIDMGGPPCEGGPGGGEETGNNLSLPTKFVPSEMAPGAPGLRLECGAALAPGWDGLLPTFPPEDPVYWVQKSEATWTADCTTDETTNVSAKWGDNLVGEGQLKAGRPIRVEVNLTDILDETVATGYVVNKLTDELDRLATYGTDGTTLTQNYRVFDAGAKLTIEECDDTECLNVANPPIYEGAMSAEVNSIGAVVYGYNWGTRRINAAESGVYRLTFYANNTTLTAVQDAKASLCEALADNCTYVIVTVTPD